MPDAHRRSGESWRETYSVLNGADAVVHLASIPAMHIRTPDVTFRNNVMSTYNVLEAATVRRIES